MFCLSSDISPTSQIEKTTKLNCNCVVERSLSTLVHPLCMSLLLQLCGRVSNFRSCSPGLIPSRDKGDKHFSPVTLGTQRK